MARPFIIITGATGFLGGRLVRQLRKEYRIIALGRRTPQEAGVPEGAGIHWFRVDIGDFDRLREVFVQIKEMGQSDLLLHLAAYYDFTGDDHPEYERTNITGTRHVLSLAEDLKLRRFIFASSGAACPFPKPGECVSELTPPTADIPYARSKRKGEEMLREFKDRVPSCIVRAAAIFSSWCQYEPLDEFITTWCSHRWNARIIGGVGDWAIPYLHVHDLASFFVRLVERCDDLESAEILLASPDGATTQLDLFNEVTREFFGFTRRTIHIPKPAAVIGITMREVLGRITGKMPFERAWMARYIDRKLMIDASRTRRLIDWAPHQNLSLLDTIPSMIHNFKKHPEEWRLHSRRKKARGPGKPALLTTSRSEGREGL